MKKQKGKQGWEERVKNEREAEKQQQQKRKDPAEMREIS